jgi:hypothetical protein
MCDKAAARVSNGKAKLFPRMNIREIKSVASIARRGK